MLVPLMNATFMRRCTPLRAFETTRKPAGVLTLFLALASLFSLAGCATPGPLHVYTIAATSERAVVDRRGEQRQTQPSFLATEERLGGFAYDPFTDHFFLRLAPGNRIRVVDRPARAIKREFEIAGLPLPGEGDMAVRPRDGHLFLLVEGGRQIAEATRLGALRRIFPLPEPATPASGLAYDRTRDELLVLHATGRQGVRVTMAGVASPPVTLDHDVGAALAFDAVARELYALSPDGAAVLIFSEAGHLLRAERNAEHASVLDVGPRSFIRVF